MGPTEDATLRDTAATPRGMMSHRLLRKPELWKDAGVGFSLPVPLHTPAEGQGGRYCHPAGDVHLDSQMPRVPRTDPSLCQ